ncbi:MAG: DUF6249 domain-containing protein [[Clostridium] fimetarium]|nr:DUF6249 domain-containing protein [Alistipes timonensis]MCM1405666.1 DUF6249 domain-containing protein [[Clostridium] fimetarium]
MKKTLAIAASLLLALCPVSAVNTDSINNIAAKAAQCADSVSAAVIDSVAPQSARTENSNQARVVESEDGDSYLLFNGQAYAFSDVANQLEYAPEDYAEDAVDQKLKEIDTWGVLGILAICFGFPALVVVVALILIIGFFTKRNRERNALISQAIDNGYQLPDAFYSNQQHEASDGSTQTPRRDPRKFSSAMTLIAVGLCLSVFFLVIDAPVGFIAGGIPLLLGAGKLIGYFCLPEYGASADNARGGNHSANDGREGSPCPPPPPAETFYYDPRDPRYNGGRR